jgi:UDP-N-acetylglucosamine--dolichyl-phosphate N-acetylglucosaminephosphotransferase
MNILVYACALAGGITSYIAIPWLIRYLKSIGLMVKDQNKKDKPLVPLSGGLGVFAGFFVGLMIFMFFRTFFYNGVNSLILDVNQLIFLFAALISILMVTLVGFLDDILVNKSGEESAGLKQWQKPLLTLVAAVPLMVVNAGTSVMNLPFLGSIEFGVLYPLLFIPIGFVGAANMVNLLEGFNGLAAGMGIIYLGSLGMYAYVNERYLAALIALMVFVPLLVFWFFNKCPAKILPGDSLTYLLGGILASIAIVGNMEKAALIVSIPFIFEFILKLRRRLSADTYGMWINGKIQSKYDHIYSIPHLFTKNGNYTEKQVVYFTMIITAFFSLLIWVM